MILVVGGQSRKIGKSSVVAALIKALPEARWTALKITSHTHGGHGAGEHSVIEETRPASTDTGRFLAAGAVRSYLVSASAGQLTAVLPALQRIIETSPNTIIESNSILGHLTPGLYLQVVAPDGRDWKDSAQAHRPSAGAFLVVQPPGETGAPAHIPAGVPCFVVRPPAYSSPELVAFVKERLSLPEDGGSTSLPPGQTDGN